MLKTTIIHLTVNSNGRDIGGVLAHSTPATPAHKTVIEAMSAAFSIALEKEGANAANGLPDATIAERAKLSTRFNLLLKKNGPKHYNDGVLDCINALKN
jgi:hypothetical protein